MRKAALALLLLSTLTLGAATRARDVVPLADGCTIAKMDGCDTLVRGKLAAGDCVTDDGKLLDLLTFEGTAGQELAITLRPLSDSYSAPFLVLVPPAGDGSETPVVAGGPDATVWYQLSSSGTWTIGVSTRDVTAEGDYAVHLDCFPDANPGGPQSCIDQELLCGQTGAWTLTSQSCRFTGGKRLYNSWLIYAKKGDLLTLEMRSPDFAPLMGIYDENNQLLKSSSSNNGVARLTYIPSKTALLYVLTTSTTDNVGGYYEVSLDCHSSGCLFPYIPNDIPDVIAPSGETPTITFDVNAVGGYHTQLRDALTHSVVAESSTNSVRAATVSEPRTYYIWVENDCGSWQSNFFTVRPQGPAKQRSVRH